MHRPLQGKPRGGDLVFVVFEMLFVGQEETVVGPDTPLLSLPP